MVCSCAQSRTITDIHMINCIIVVAIVVVASAAIINTSAIYIRSIRIHSTCPVYCQCSALVEWLCATLLWTHAYAPTGAVAPGSHVNKRRVPPREYTQLYVGDVLRFGDSKRLHCLQGPPELRKDVLRDKLSPAEVQKLKYDLLQEKKRRHQASVAAAAAAASEQLSSATCLWGDREDAEEELAVGVGQKEAAMRADGGDGHPGGLSSFGSAQRV